MKTIFLFMCLSLSLSAFARNDKLANDCVFPAIAALNHEAYKLGETFKLGSIYICGMDSRKLNPYKYVWYCGETKESKKELKVLLATFMGGSCKRY